MAPGRWLGAALVEPERRVDVGHQREVGEHPEHPSVEPDQQIEEPAGVAADHGEVGGDHEDQQADQPSADRGQVRARVRVEVGADHDPDDEQVGQDEEPLDEDQPAGELLRVGDRERRRVRRRSEGERRVAVGAEREVAVVADAPGPSQDADVEVEEATGIALGQQDADPGGHGGEDERGPQPGEEKDVGHQQDPLDRPEPASRDGVDAGVQHERLDLPFAGGRRRRHGRDGALRRVDGRRRTAPIRQSAPSASNDRAAGVRYSIRAPALATTSSGAVPSRFMITRDQRPSSTGQVRSCVPVPPLEATQKVWSAGGAGIDSTGHRPGGDVAATDVHELRVGDAGEVGADVGGSGDAGEDGSVAGLRRDPDRGDLVQPYLTAGPRAEVGVDVGHDHGVTSWL